MPLKSPEDVRRLLERRFEVGRGDWMTGTGVWPMSIPLGAVSERQAQAHAEVIREWMAAWSACQLPGEVKWDDRSWPRLGSHRLPTRLTLETAAQVAAWAGE